MTALSSDSPSAHMLGHGRQGLAVVLAVAGNAPAAATANSSPMTGGAAPARASSGGASASLAIPTHACISSAAQQQAERAVKQPPGADSHPDDLYPDDLYPDDLRAFTPTAAATPTSTRAGPSVLGNSSMLRPFASGAEGLADASTACSSSLSAPGLGEPNTTGAPGQVIGANTVPGTRLGTHPAVVAVLPGLIVREMSLQLMQQQRGHQPVGECHAAGTGCSKAAAAVAATFQGSDGGGVQGSYQQGHLSLVTEVPSENGHYSRLSSHSQLAPRPSVGVAGAGSPAASGSLNTSPRQAQRISISAGSATGGADGAGWVTPTGSLAGGWVASGGPARPFPRSTTSLTPQHISECTSQHGVGSRTASFNQGQAASGAASASSLGSTVSNGIQDASMYHGTMGLAGAASTAAPGTGIHMSIHATSVQAAPHRLSIGAMGGSPPTSRLSWTSTVGGSSPPRGGDTSSSGRIGSDGGGSGGSNAAVMSSAPQRTTRVHLRLKSARRTLDACAAEGRGRSASDGRRQQHTEVCTLEQQDGVPQQRDMVSDIGRGASPRSGSRPGTPSQSTDAAARKPLVPGPNAWQGNGCMTHQTTYFEITPVDDD